ncbi:hypothetical protein JXB02_04430 [Candidatus Woesearchaeota archaeon]|nr:hypothetical protein [Candidatus Woesearchaeota archaeon]
MAVINRIIDHEHHQLLFATYPHKVSWIINVIAPQGYFDSIGIKVLHPIVGWFEEIGYDWTCFKAGGYYSDETISIFDESSGTSERHELFHAMVDDMLGSTQYTALEEGMAHAWQFLHSDPDREAGPLWERSLEIAQYLRTALASAADTYDPGFQIPLDWTELLLEADQYAYFPLCYAVSREYRNESELKDIFISSLGRAARYNNLRKGIDLLVMKTDIPQSMKRFYRKLQFTGAYDLSPTNQLQEYETIDGAVYQIGFPSDGQKRFKKITEMLYSGEAIASIGETVSPPALELLDR